MVVVQLSPIARDGFYNCEFMTKAQGPPGTKVLRLDPPDASKQLVDIPQAPNNRELGARAVSSHRCASPSISFRYCPDVSIAVEQVFHTQTLLLSHRPQLQNTPHFR